MVTSFLQTTTAMILLLLEQLLKESERGKMTAAQLLEAAWKQTGLNEQKIKELRAQFGAVK
jgi:hypothetical protein